MKVKELKKILGLFNNNCVVKINGNDISVVYSQDQDGKWTINIICPAAAKNKDMNENAALDGEASLH